MDLVEAPFYGYRVGVGPSTLNIYGRFDDLCEGDIVQMPWVKRYQHRATLQITKINKKSIKAVEIKGSYGQGTEWTISIGYESLQIDNCHMSNERLAELKAKWG